MRRGTGVPLARPTSVATRVIWPSRRWVLLVARLLWGLAFAAMNVATQALATAEPQGAARRSGTMRSIIAAGPVSGLVAGAIVAQFVGPRAAFLLLAMAALLAFPFAFSFTFEGGGSGAGFAAVRGSDFFPSAIACCHTAPIGNLGMRTQATRHFDCTGHLHGVLQAALFDENVDS